MGHEINRPELTLFKIPKQTRSKITQVKLFVINIFIFSVKLAYLTLKHPDCQSNLAPKCWFAMHVSGNPILKESLCQTRITQVCRSQSISKVWNMLRHGPVWRVQNKECYFKFTFTISGFFLLGRGGGFPSKNCFFLSFSFIFSIKYQIPETKY